MNFILVLQEKLIRLMFFKNFGSETKELFYKDEILTEHELYIRNLLFLDMKA